MPVKSEFYMYKGKTAKPLTVRREIGGKMEKVTILLSPNKFFQAGADEVVCLGNLAKKKNPDPQTMKLMSEAEGISTKTVQDDRAIAEQKKREEEAAKKAAVEAGEKSKLPFSEAISEGGKKRERDRGTSRDRDKNKSDDSQPQG